MSPGRRGPVDPGVELRRRAIEVLERVEGGAELDRAVDRALRAEPGLPDRDRGLLTALCYESVRHRSRLDARLAAQSSRPLGSLDPPVRAALRLGVAQLLLLDAVPDHAAVHTVLEALRVRGLGRAVGFANAVLRATVREGDAEERDALARLDPLGRIARLHSFPGWLVERWVHRWGVEETERRCVALNRPAGLVLRVRPGVSPEAVVDAIRDAGVEAELSRYVPGAVRTASTDPARLPGWSEGSFRVQDEASQLVGWLLDPQPGDRVLDLCAGMGTKTQQIRERAPSAYVVAADRSRSRLGRLRASLTPLVGAVPAVVSDGTIGGCWADGSFDRVLVDAPCTGLGTIRRHPEIKWRRRPGDPARLACVQVALLEEAARIVRPGGVIVYAVCSPEPDEGEDVVRTVASRAGLRVEDCRPVLPEAVRSSVPDGASPFRSDLLAADMDLFVAAHLTRSRRA